MNDIALQTQTAVYPSLRGKRVVVTGGGSGIGATIVAAFARQGAHVSFLDIAVEESRTVERSLSKSSPAPRFYNCDLRDLKAVHATFAQIAERTGPTQILINNAGNDDRHAFESVSPEYWDD